ncbi:MAG TPA: hypothetical protein VFO89_03060 [Thermoanaerobaculia bacterium]|nr:hypothetical protein [Thermoanaerobaculia bacterium]
MPKPSAPPLDPDLVLPATLLSRYLFFLGRRPVSAANAHYRSSRIGALQSLAVLFDDAEIREPLRALTPANLFRVAPRLQNRLQPSLAYRLPRDLVATPHAPPPEFWRGVRRIAVIYGPAIGIGDEIVASSIPRVLQTLAPHASLDVLTAYAGLWERIAPDARASQYASLAVLLERIRGGGDEAIVYIDFEPPGLLAAVAQEPGVTRFAELSVGTRSLTFLDASARRLHTMPAEQAARENFYDAVRAMSRWLLMTPQVSSLLMTPQLSSLLMTPQVSSLAMGPTSGDERAEGPGQSALPALPALGADVPRNGRRRTIDRLHRVVVSPFTSKEDPSERVWRGILTAALAPAPELHIVLDTGPNAATRAFAIAIRDVLRAHGLRCDLAAGGRAASLGEMLDLARDADAVIAADSYLAHAAPLFGALTLVVAREGLEPWRVPSPESFYFRSELDPDAIGAAMSVLLREPRVSPRQSLEAAALRDAAAAVDLDAPLDALLDAWQRCFDAHNALLATLPEWPAPFATLMRDERYSRILPRAPRRDGIGESELRAHLARRFADCAESNLWKFVRGTV